MRVMPKGKMPITTHIAGFDKISVRQQLGKSPIRLNPDGKNRHHIRAVRVKADPPEPLRLALRAVHAARQIETLKCRVGLWVAD